MHASRIPLGILCIALLASVAAAGAPVASFSASPTSGVAPMTVNFTDTSSGSPTGWAWYLGDETYYGLNLDPSDGERRLVGPG